MTQIYRDAEVGLLGSLLVDAPGCAAEIMLALTDEDFQSPDCRTVFNAARALWEEDSPVDPITVAARAGEAYRRFVREIEEVTPTAAHWRGYLDALRRQSMLLRVQRLASEIAGGAAVEADPGQLQEQAEQLLDALSDTGGQRRDYTMTELLTRFFTRQGEPREYLDWGFPQLNRHLFCGMGAYVLLAARPSVGKTALALQLGLHFAKLGKKVDFFSYETDEEKAADRIMSAQSLVSFAAINQGGIADEASMKNLISAKKRLMNRPFRLIEASGMTVENVRAQALRHGAEVVIIDYLQLIAHKNGRLSEYERVTEISRSLQTLCKRYRLTVIALSQLSRIEDNAEPSLTHLRSSGQLEQDADAAMLLYRPPFNPLESPQEQRDAKNRRFLKIAKNKNGKTGKIKLWFNGDIQTFSEQWRGYYEAPEQPAGDVELGLADPGQQHQVSLCDSKQTAQA